MIIFLHGEDTYRSRQKLDEIIAKFEAKDSSGMNLAVLSMKESKFADFSKTVTAMPFMGDRRLVVAKNLLSEAKADLQEPIAKMLKDKKIPAETTVIFYEQAKPDRRKKLFKDLNKEKLAQEFKLLADYEVSNWVQAEVARREGEIAPSAAAKLAAYIGNDLWRLSNEIEKLIIYRSNQEIRAEDVELLVKAKLDENIFNLVDAVSNSNVSQALKLLHENFEQGQSEQYLLAMISYQFRNLAQIKPLLDEGMPEDLIKKQTGLHPFVIKKTATQARRFSQDKIKKIYDILVRTDIAMKTGKVEQKTALDLLVVGLCR
ncbi:DNA polymerase III subunit delta [Patescibacteria group bacterium]